MATSTLKTRIKHKIDTASNWASSSLVPLEGELIIYKGDKPQIKVGDGSTTVGSLPFIKAGSDTTITQALTSGTEIGSINIDGVATKLYAPSTIAWSSVTSKPSYYDAKAIKSITRSGTTFTWTCMDGTTGTFTQQDNNTTYSAGTGLTLSGTTFSLNATATKTALGLGSNAYTSTAYLPLTGGSMSGAIVAQPSAKNTFLLWGSSTDKNSSYDIPWYGLSFYNDGVQQGNALALANYWGINFITAGDSNTHLYHNGNLILNTSNYTNYAPTKTGSGASGTWGINITGSSASCTGNAARAGFITCEDNRATMATPNEYTMGADLEFKSAEATGLSGYSAVLTVKPWTDSSGGVVHQLAFNASGLYHRISTSNLASWGSWCKLWQAGDAVTGAVWN